MHIFIYKSTLKSNKTVSFIHTGYPIENVPEGITGYERTFRQNPKTRQAFLLGGQLLTQKV